MAYKVATKSDGQYVSYGGQGIGFIRNKVEPMESKSPNEVLTFPTVHKPLKMHA